MICEVLMDHTLATGKPLTTRQPSARIAVERVLQVLRTELAAPPAVFLRQHPVTMAHCARARLVHPGRQGGLSGRSTAAR